MQELTHSLLALSKIEAAENGTSYTPVNLTLLLQQIGERYASQAEQNDIQFDINIPEAAVHINGSDQQLQQAVGNLLNNALKFTSAGGHVTLSLNEKNNEAKIEVTDTGIGIPEADMAGLFGRFHRGRNVGDFPGNGLGLAIVQAIVAQHGGEVTAVSQPQNTQFTITLPRAYQDATLR